MKKSILLFASVLLLAITTSNATHIVGGEWSVQWVSGNTYHITLNHYRDCTSSTDFQTPIPVALYDRVTNAMIDTFCMTLGSRTTLSLGDSCFTPSVCVELGVYQMDVTIPNNPNGYYIAYSRCCRNGIITNIQNPGDAGEVWYAEIPDPALQNSTPVFGPYPRGYMCAHETNIQNFACTDVDGDSLVYSLVTPLNGNLNTNTVYLASSCAPGTIEYKEIPDPGPYPLVVWEPPYSATNMVGGTPAMSIDPHTGILTANPPNLGVFVFCVRVQEYRRSDQKYLGEVLRDVQYAVLTCASAAAYPDTTICSGSSVQLNATGSGSSYIWTPTAGLSNPNIANPVATPTVTTTYTVSIPSGNCSSSAVVTVTVIPSISVSIKAGGPTTFCQGGSVSLTASGGSTYSWNTGATTSTISVDTAGTYTVKGSSNGCSNTANQIINVNASPKVTITPGGPTAFCEGDSVTLTVSGAQSYLWNTGSTNTSITTSINETYSAVGTSASGCTGTSNSITTTLYRRPIITVNANGPTSFCQGDGVQICASGGTSYSWSPGGSTSNCINASSQGHYTVTATGSNECKGSSGIDVTVLAGPTVTIAANGPTSFCPGDSVTLTAEGANSYIWSPGGETTSSITVHSGGSYFATGTTSGCSGSSDPIMVSINSSLGVSITPDGDTTFCSGGSVGLCATSGSAYLWTPNGETTQCITASNTAAYGVTVTSASGCMGSSSIQITANPLPTVTVVANGPVDFCQPLTVTLTVSGADSYVWNPGGQTSSSIVVNSSGLYYAVGSDANGCSAPSNTINVTVNQPPTVAATPNGQTTFCTGDSVSLSASGADTYLWSPTNETTSSITVKTSGTYFVVGTNNDGCSGTSNSISVTVNPLPVVVVTPDGTTTFCNGDSVILTASGADSYLWSSNGETTTSVTVKTQGTYYAVGTVVTGCSSTSNSVSVTVNPNPSVSVIPQGNTAICEGGSVELCASNGTTFSWNMIGGSNQCFSAMDPGSYIVTITDANGCTGVSVPLDVTVALPPTVFVSANGPTEFCAGGSVTLTAATADHYLWNTGDTTTSIIVSQNGSFFTTGTNDNGCSSISNTVDVVVDPLPTVVATPNGPTEFCNGSSVTITGSGAVSYLWNPTGDQTTSITVSSAGSYYTVGTDINGCTGTSNSVPVTVDPNPTVTVIPQGNTVICEGGSVELCASNGTTFSWNLNEGTNQCFNAMDPGNYIVTITDVNGCTGVSLPLAVTVGLPPSVGANVSGPLTCSTSSVTISANECDLTPGVTYSWSGPGNFSSTEQCPAATVAGTYTVTAFNGCPNTAITTVESNTAIPDVTATGGEISCLQPSVQLIANSTTSDVTYGWTGPNGFTSTQQDPTVSDSGTYIVTVTDQSNGCTNSASVHISALPDQVSGVCGDQGSVASGIYFQLNGNPNSTPPNPPDNWDLIYKGTSLADYTTGIITDFPSNADNYFVQGTKDIQDITGWNWNTQSVPDKDDLLHAGVAVYGHLLYFFADRYAVNGNSQMGFWLLKNNIQPLTGGTFSGAHAIGDLLILSDFENGNPVLFAYEWVGSGGSNGTLNALTLEEANSYAIVNSASVSSPWAYTPKFGPSGIFPPGAFFEGGIDLACLKGSSIDGCYPSFIIETRTSQSVTSELKDFIVGNLVVNPNIIHRMAQPVENGKLLLNAYPNPFSSVSTIEFERTSYAAHTLVEVYTLTGEKIATLFDKNAEAGITYKVAFDGSAFPAGVYIYRISGGGQITNGKLVLIK